MPDIPFSCEPPAHPDQPTQQATGADPAGAAGRARPGSPPNVWLCADPPGLPDPLFPLWARRVIHTLSEPCEPVIIRAPRGYPGLAEDVAALLRVAAATGRRPIALLPTPCWAAPTRALLRHPAPTPDIADPVADAMATDRPVAMGHPVATETAETVRAGGHCADTETVPGHQMAASRRPVAGGHIDSGPDTNAATDTWAATDTSPAADTKTAADTSPSADTSPAADTGACVAVHRSVPVARVGVGRRRPGLEHGPAAAVIVLAGPVGPHARLTRRAQRTGLPSARLLASWARVLEPGGVIGVLSPPPTGRHRRDSDRAGGAPVTGVGRRGLLWSDRIVLVHAGTHTGPDTSAHADSHGGGLGHHAPPRPPHTPFAQVHSFLDLYEADDIDPGDTGDLAGPGVDGTWR